MGNNKVRPTTGLALFAYQVLNAAEVVHLLPVERLANETLSEDTNNRTALSNNKADEVPNSRATKVLQVRNSNNTSEVRRPVGICMSVMSTVFCRKVPSSFFFVSLTRLDFVYVTIHRSGLLWSTTLLWDVKLDTS